MTIASIIVINSLLSSIDALCEWHIWEVKEPKKRVSKSWEVEALLRSDIRVLEQEIMQAERMDDCADARAMYRIRTNPRIDADANLLQSLEKKYDWLMGMRALKAEKN